MQVPRFALNETTPKVGKFFCDALLPSVLLIKCLPAHEAGGLPSYPAAMTESSTLPGPVIIIIRRTNNNKKIRCITVATRILIKTGTIFLSLASCSFWASERRSRNASWFWLGYRVLGPGMQQGICQTSQGFDRSTCITNAAAPCPHPEDVSRL